MVELGINFMTLQMATKSWSTLALGLVVFVVLLAYVQAQRYDDHLGKLNRNFPTKIQILMNLKLLKKCMKY